MRLMTFGYFLHRHEEEKKKNRDFNAVAKDTSKLDKKALKRKRNGKNHVSRRNRKQIV